MSIENPFSKPIEEKKPEDVKGDGFVIKRGGTIRHNGDFSYKTHPVEFRPGESTDKKIKEDETAQEKEAERTKDFMPADLVEEFFTGVMRYQNPYSETFKIKSDGTFDKAERFGGSAFHIGEAYTPEKLYRIAKDIQEKHPEYQFNFETDPQGKWLKYTVSKSKTKK